MDGLETYIVLVHVGISNAHHPVLVYRNFASLSRAVVTRALRKRVLGVVILYLRVSFNYDFEHVPKDSHDSRPQEADRDACSHPPCHEEDMRIYRIHGASHAPGPCRPIQALRKSSQTGSVRHQQRSCYARVHCRRESCHESRYQNPWNHRCHYGRGFQRLRCWLHHRNRSWLRWVSLIARVRFDLML